MSLESESMRLFIGIPVSLRTLRAVAGAATLIKEQSTAAKMDLRWVAPARYHVTLSYLGWVKPEVVPAIRDRVQRAIVGHKPFEMRCRDLGGFPSIDKAQVLWAGIDDGAGSLAALAGSVSAAMVELGFPAESRAFHPHLTMARCKGAPDLTKLVQSVPAHVFSKSAVESLLLYKSSVESETSEYEKIASWRLE